MTREEAWAELAAKEAEAALVQAIKCYEEAGFGGHVTDPLRKALAEVQFSIREVSQ